MSLLRMEFIKNGTTYTLRSRREKFENLLRRRKLGIGDALPTTLSIVQYNRSIDLGYTTPEL